MPGHFILSRIYFLRRKLHLIVFQITNSSCKQTFSYSHYSHLPFSKLPPGRVPGTTGTVYYVMLRYITLRYAMSCCIYIYAYVYIMFVYVHTQFYT
jgi:hypothetical protein